MKFKEYTLKDPQQDHRFIPQEAESAGEYLGLDDRSVLRLRLLAEELICMLPQLLYYGPGKFWIEADEKQIELHLKVMADKIHDYDVDRILSVSSDGRNAAAKGIIGKIAVAVERMLGNNENIADYDSYGVWSRGLAGSDRSAFWSLEAYKDAFKDKQTQQEYSDDWDELEKSIIANVADDVRVGVLGGKIDIIVIKTL
jgi:hypothetical protein